MRLVQSLMVDACVVALVAAAMCAFGCATIVGGSMRPTLDRGDVVVFRRGGSDVTTGSLVILGEPGHAYVHRVVGRMPDGSLITRGDANPIVDRDPVDGDTVRGSVVLRVPSGGLIRRLASSGGRVRLWGQSHTRAMTETASER